MPRQDPRLQDEAQTVNERIQDRAIQHALFLEGFKTREQREIAAILDDSLIRVLDRLDARLARIAEQGFDRGPETTERLRQLANIYSEMIDATETQAWDTLKQDLYELSADEAAFQLGVIENTVPVNLEMAAPAPSRLRSLVTSQPMDGRILRQWFRDASAKSKREFNAVVNRAVTEGLTFQQIAREVRGTTFERIEGGVMKTFQDDYGALVRSAVTHVSVHAKEEAFLENADLIKGVQWVLTLDTRTCRSCVEAAERRTKLGKGVYPIGEGPRPPRHINCRCTTAPVLKSARELGIPAADFPPGTHASMNGQVAEDLAYTQWLKRQSAATQDEALGPKKGRIFRAGGESPGTFATRTGHVRTLKEIRKLEPDIFERAGI